MELSLAFSPCPNDCFIFDAMVHGKVNTEGISFSVKLEDVETLNRHAMEEKYDITKLSFHAFAYVADNYLLLNAGSALGFNCGPLLIARKEVADPSSEINSVLIPGRYTTANFLLTIAYPQIRNKKECVFSEIEDRLLKGEADAGLIIHENRFTYQSKGLVKVRDLGEYWDEQIHAPIPLGGIAIHRRHPESMQKAVNRIIRRSVEFAFENPSAVMDYVRQHAQEMDEQVMKQHIALYVNRFSVDLGDTGRSAIDLMFRTAQADPAFPKLPPEIYAAV